MSDRPTPVSTGTFPRHAEFCAAFLPDPEHEDCALPCDCGLDEMRCDLKAAEARSQGLEDALERIEERLNPGKTGNPANKTTECLHIATEALSLGLPDEEGQGHPHA